MTSNRAATYLDRILVAHRAEAAADDRPFEALLASAREVDEPVRGFTSALIGSDRLAVIAEVKRRSPSKGALARRPRPVRARAALRGRWGGLSVGAHRRGVLRRVGRRPASGAGGESACRCCARTSRWLRPTCVDARIMGADAVLLIAAALDDERAARLPRAGRRARPRRAGGGARRGRARAGAGGRGDARSASTSATSSRSRSTPTGRCAWRRRCPTAWCGVAESGVRDADDAQRLRRRRLPRRAGRRVTGDGVRPSRAALAATPRPPRIK